MVYIFWEIVLSVAGIGMGFFAGDFMLGRLGIKKGKQSQRLTLKEIPEYLKNKFLVNTAILAGGEKRIIGLEEVDVIEMKKIVEEMNCSEIVIFNENQCRFAIKKGNTFIYVRGRIASMRELYEIWEVIHRALTEVKR
ncbi:MAG: hypothetical protein QXK70_05820 [Archaeoglobaceae archaeon]